MKHHVPDNKQLIRKAEIAKFFSQYYHENLLPVFLVLSADICVS